MATDTRFGTFEELLVGLAPALEQLMRHLYALIREVHPDATEVVRLGDNAISFGVGPKKMSEAHTYLMPMRRQGYVNLGFYHAAPLPDPTGLLEGTGKNLRHVKVRTPAEAENPALRALLIAAVAERRAALAGSAAEA